MKMFRKQWCAIFITCLLVAFSFGEECEQAVFVDETLSNQTCIPYKYGIFNCGSFAHALTNPKFMSNTCFYLSTDVSLNETIDIKSASGLWIRPEDDSIVEIFCNADSAIRFHDSRNIKISGLTFQGCGSLFKIDWMYQDLQTDTVNISAAVAFIRSEVVHVSNSMFLSSQGYALAFDEADQVSITRTFVTNSTHVIVNYRDNNYSVGGGVFIHWQESHSKRISIVETALISSRSHNLTELVEPIDNLPYEKGAGFAIFFGESVRNNSVRMENITASNSSAGMGSGIYVHFGDECIDNSVNCENVTMEFNVAKKYGGAVFVHHDSKERNDFSVRNSILNTNEANVGGAVCLIYFNAQSKDERIQFFFFKNVEMIGNRAQVGQTFHVQNAFVHLQDVTISKSNYRSDSHLPGQGSVYALRSTLKFTGNSNLLKHNNNSAVILDSSEILAGGSIAFNNNIGYNGGAIAFYEHSKLFLSSQTQLSFLGNVVTNKGGAIYVLTPGPSLMPWDTTELNIYGCFLQFTDSTYVSFTGRVVFNDNRCTEEEELCDIFASSLQSCASPSDNNRSHIISSWKNFHFYSNTSTISTNAIHMLPLNFSEWQSFPGDLLHPHVIFKDERQNDVRESISVAVEPSDKADIETNPAFVVDKEESIRMTLLKKKGYNRHPSSFNLRIKTTSDVFLEQVLQNVTFKNCRFGYVLGDGESCECDVQNNEKRGIAFCDSDDIYLERNRWVDTHEETSHICPFGYCDNNPDERFNLYDKDNQCSQYRDQNSRLCSKCKTGYSVSSVSMACIECDHDSKGWIGVTLATCFGLSFFILIVLLSGIDIMSFNINICLYSYDIIDLLYTNEQVSVIDPFLNFIMSIFQFTSTNGVYPSYCMWYGMNALQKTAYGYLIPGWMITFMAMLYPCVRNKRSWMERWFKTLSIVFMMCLSDLLRVSFELLHFTEINGTKYLYKYAEVEYFGDEHLPYALAAIVVLILLILFGIAQILLFLRDHVDLFEWLRKFQDNVCDYFKKGKTWFWLFYIVCRVEIYAVGIFLPNMRKIQLGLLALSCFVIANFFAYQSPFKDNYINLVETIVLTALAVISVMAVGIRGVYLSNDQSYFLNWVHALSYVPLLAIVVTILKSLYKVISTKKTKAHGRRASRICNPVRVFDAYDDHKYQRLTNEHQE